MPRKQDDNLKPARTKSEARERGKNGGKASGVARRKKKALKEEFELLLSMPHEKRVAERKSSKNWYRHR